MGEIADMMLDGTMDCETGEWNFDSEDGPGWPMTGRDAAIWKRRATGGRGNRPPGWEPETVFKVSKALRKKLSRFGELKACSEYHWQIRKEGKVVADWWPHRMKFRIAGKSETLRGDERVFCAALMKAD